MIRIKNLQTFQDVRVAGKENVMLKCFTSDMSMPYSRNNLCRCEMYDDENGRIWIKENDTQTIFWISHNNVLSAYPYEEDGKKMWNSIVGNVESEEPKRRGMPKGGWPKKDAEAAV